MARQVCRADPDVEDVAAFGERLHLRLRGRRRRRMVPRADGDSMERLPRGAWLPPACRCMSCGRLRRRWKTHSSALLQAGRGRNPAEASALS